MPGRVELRPPLLPAGQDMFGGQVTSRKSDRDGFQRPKFTLWGRRIHSDYRTRKSAKAFAPTLPRNPR